MPLSDGRKAAILTALEIAEIEAAAAGDRDKQRALVRTLAEVAGDVPTRELRPLLREHLRRLQLAALRDQRTIRATAAIAEAVAREGVATPGELLARRSYTSVAELLSELGFVGELGALAADVEEASRRARR